MLCLISTGLKNNILVVISFLSLIIFTFSVQVKADHKAPHNKHRFAVVRQFQLRLLNYGIWISIHYPSEDIFIRSVGVRSLFLLPCHTEDVGADGPQIRKMTTQINLSLSLTR